MALFRWENEALFSQRTAERLVPNQSSRRCPPLFSCFSPQWLSRAREWLSRFPPGLLIGFDPFLYDLAVGIGSDHEATAFLLYHLDIAGFALRHVTRPCYASAPTGV